MVNAGGEVDICRKIVSENRVRGIETYILPQMFDEIKNSFEFANSAYHRRGKNIAEVSKFYKEMGISSDVFDGYLKKLNEKPTLAWPTYISTFWSHTQPEMLQSYLKNEMSIEIFRADSMLEREVSIGVEKTTELLLKVRRQALKPSEISDEDELRKYERQLRLRRNEATLMSLICVLRKRASESGESQEIWFLTFDEFVYQTNAKLSKTDNIYLHPCYYKPARWLQLLSIFATKPVPESTFRQLLLSEEVKRLASMIEAEVINQMLKNRIDEEIRNIETLKNIFKEIVNRPAIQEAYEEMTRSKGVGQLKGVVKTQNLIIKELKSKIGRMKFTFAKVKVEEEKERKRTKYYRQQVSRLTGKKDKRKKKRRKKRK